MKIKFIATNGMYSDSFTATRTTGSHADYYIVDVIASKVDDKVVITISFVKVGTRFLKLQ